MSQQIGVSVPDSETLSSDKSKRFTVGLISQYFFLASSLSFVALDEFVFLREFDLSAYSQKAR